MTQTVAIYIRVSTRDQDTKRQFDELRDYATNNYPDATIEEYADIISGADETGGDDFQRLWDDIAEEKFDVVIVHEISRLSRLGRAAIAEFIKHGTKHGAGVESFDVGLEIRVDDPELQKTVYTMVASLMGDLAKIEHQQKLDRINSDDGSYLIVDPDKYVRMQSALELLETEVGILCKSIIVIQLVCNVLRHRSDIECMVVIRLMLAWDRYPILNLAVFMNWRLSLIAAIMTAGYFLMWAYHIYVQAKRRMDHFSADRVRAV